MGERGAPIPKREGGLDFGNNSCFLVSNSEFRDDEDRYRLIDNYLPREPPPVGDFVQLEKECQENDCKIDAVGGGSLAFRHTGSPST